MHSLNLHAHTVDQAIPKLRRFLAHSYHRGMHEICIIHGKGTGTLREYVRSQLRSWPHIQSIRSGSPKEGGDGVTIVVFS